MDQVTYIIKNALAKNSLENLVNSKLEELYKNGAKILSIKFQVSDDMTTSVVQIHYRIEDKNWSCI